MNVPETRAAAHPLKSLLLWAACLPALAWGQGNSPMPSPAPQATGISPDTQLSIRFDSPPTLGSAGLIRIHDADDGRVVDTLDLAIPASPNRRMTPAEATADAAKKAYQSTRIAGRDWHFRPVIVRDNVATIYPHHGVLAYGRRYRVTVDAGVLQPAAIAWTFATRKAAPAADSTRLVVAADGSGDFATVQGAVDFVPDKPARRTTIFIRNGFYEEIVSLAGKSNLILRGEHRDKVQVGYANNSAFNPGGRARWAFSIVNGEDIQLSSFTINNHAVGQAEALMTRGERIVLSDMTLNGSGDALTTYGTLYVQDSKLTGHGDTILGYAAAYFLRTELVSIGPFSWTRTPAGQHGNVFVDCRFIASEAPLPWAASAPAPVANPAVVFARLPRNNSATRTADNFPHAEMVLINTRTQGISPEGWGPVEEAPGFDSSQVRFWEFNTTDLQGKPVDVSRRHPVSRQLTLEKDAALIADYKRPEFVLGGWKPVVE
jgi:pectinesterase